MKKFKVFVTEDAKEDLKRYRDYLLYVKKSSQAAKNLLSDFRDTRLKLKIVAGSLKEPDSEVLKSLGLKRMNFSKHDYFMLFSIRNDEVFITNVFHFLEDVENKLR